MIIIAGTLEVAPEQRDELLQLAVPLMEATHKEEGNHEYVFSADPLDPGRVRIFEKWENDEVLGPHMASPHMGEFGAALGKLKITGSSLTKYSVTDEGPL